MTNLETDLAKPFEPATATQIRKTLGITGEDEVVIARVLAESLVYKTTLGYIAQLDPSRSDITHIRVDYATCQVVGVYTREPDSSAQSVFFYEAIYPIEEARKMFSFERVGELTPNPYAAITDTVRAILEQRQRQQRFDE